MGRAGEVEQGTSELAAGNDDDVQSSVPPPWPRELAHTQVLLLLAVLLVAHQVIRQEPCPTQEGCWEGREPGLGCPAQGHLTSQASPDYPWVLCPWLVHLFAGFLQACVLFYRIYIVLLPMSPPYTGGMERSDEPLTCSTSGSVRN